MEKGGCKALIGLIKEGVIPLDEIFSFAGLRVNSLLFSFELHQNGQNGQL